MGAWWAAVYGVAGGEKGLRGSGAGTLGVPLGGTRRVGCSLTLQAEVSRTQ